MPRLSGQPDWRCNGATCAGTPPTGAVLGDDHARRLAGWENAPNSLTTASFLPDGEGHMRLVSGSWTRPLLPGNQVYNVGLREGKAP